MKKKNEKKKVQQKDEFSESPGGNFGNPRAAIFGPWTPSRRTTMHNNHACKIKCMQKMSASKNKAQCRPKPSTPGAQAARGGSQLPAAIFRPGPRKDGRAEVRVQPFCALAGLGAGALQN